LGMELLASIGAGVVAGLMTFGFFGKRLGVLAFFIATAVIGWIGAGQLREYTVLLSSLTDYGVSTLVCIAISLASKERYDFDIIQLRVCAFNMPAEEDVPEGTMSA